MAATRLSGFVGSAAISSSASGWVVVGCSTGPTRAYGVDPGESVRAPQQEPVPPPPPPVPPPPPPPLPCEFRDTRPADLGRTIRLPRDTGWLRWRTIVKKTAVGSG